MHITLLRIAWQTFILTSDKEKKLKFENNEMRGNICRNPAIKCFLLNNGNYCSDFLKTFSKLVCHSQKY